MANPVVYRSRRSQGLCGSCGKVETGSKARCEICKKKELEDKKARYEARKAAGLCPGCGNPVDGTVLCSECRGKQTGSLARYYRNKANGVCRACGADSGGKTYCEKHTEERKLDQRKRYAQRKAAQLCAGCGEPTDGTMRCPKCFARDSATQRVRNRKLRDAAFAAYGGPQCSECGENDVDVLEMDHIGGGGNVHRREIGNSRLYIWLQQHGYPRGYRVLCPTCNKKAHVRAQNQQA